MPLTYVLDSEAVSALASPNERFAAFKRAHTILTAAKLNGNQVVIPAVVLEEVYRGGRRDAAVDRVIRRERRVVPLDHRIARTAGGLLGRDGLDSCHAVDAAMVATAIALGGGVIFTSDPDDIRSLARSHRNIVVETLA